MTIEVNIGDIFLFNSPVWDYRIPPAHYLIMELSENTYRNGAMYVALHLETGKIVPDLLLDAANFSNYGVRKVG